MRDSAPFSFTPMDEASARAMLSWRYLAPYDIYNPAFVETGAALRYLVDPLNRLYAIKDDTGTLIGFCSFGADAQVPGGDYADQTALDVGLGIRPDLTGRGSGLMVVQAILVFAQEQWAPARFRMTVAAFNTRAMRVYERAGFRTTYRFLATGVVPAHFIQMVRENTGDGG